MMDLDTEVPKVGIVKLCLNSFSFPSSQTWCNCSCCLSHPCIERVHHDLKGFFVPFVASVSALWSVLQPTLPHTPLHQQLIDLQLAPHQLVLYLFLIMIQIERYGLLYEYLVNVFNCNYDILSIPHLPDLPIYLPWFLDLNFVTFTQC